MLPHPLAFGHRLESGSALQRAAVEREANARHATTEALGAAWLDRLAAHASVHTTPLMEADRLIRPPKGPGLATIGKSLPTRRPAPDDGPSSQPPAIGR